MNEQPIIWSMSAGMYPGILFGIRTYREKASTDYVLYVPFFDISITIYNNED
tara:strand:+ start:554 stop:709 length:156 start_codon:yes stop_codon:yes gene_type:complete